MLDFLFVALATFGLSSAWLYSPGPEKLRNLVLTKGGFFSPLAYCQLCCSLWIALIFSFCLLEWPLLWVIVGAFGCSGLSWMFGNLTLAIMWVKAYFEIKYNNLTKK